MIESYSDRSMGGDFASPAGAAMLGEPPGSTALARQLLAQLLPGHDSDRILRGLLVERDVQRGPVTTSADGDGETQSALRALHEVRAQLALGGIAQTFQHAFNNPLTGLLAEAQLLALEPMPAEQQRAVQRIIELARRLVTLSRRLAHPG